MKKFMTKEGKRILVERISFFWKHLSFTWKSTLRNLFRYKKRLFMTVFGIALGITVIFQIITLPVEFDASRRAMMMLREQGILGEQELGYTRKVLTAAALTYVASAAAAILQLLRIILLFGGRDRD